ncbi:MAG: DUF4854 domain-containing protein [Arachnia sp.]
MNQPPAETTTTETETTGEGTDEPGTDGTTDSSVAEALEEMLQAERDQIPQVLEESEGVLIAAEYVVEGDDTISYTFTYAQAPDPDQAKAYFDAEADSLQETCDSKVFPPMEQRGVTDPKVRYTYLNPDGTEIWSHTFERSA